MDMIDCFDPDAIIETESHMDKPVLNAEIFLPFYVPCHRDRVGRCKGGVFIAEHNRLKSDEIHVADDCKPLWATIKLKGDKNVYIVVFLSPTI